MALNDAQFKQKIIALTDEMIEKENYEIAKEIYANKLVLAVKEYLMSAQINISGTSNQGPFTGTGTIA